MSSASGLSGRKPSLVVDRYALYDEIASGGMAVVHFGRLLGPVGFSRIVAVKRLHPQYAKSPKFVAMFIDEARLAASIKHPNVVPTLDVVVHDGELFVVMEYVVGESLARLVDAVDGNVPHPIALAVMVGALAGLHAAHETRDDAGRSIELVHRDVSPQNILVGIDGIPRVLDFGIAKALGRSQATAEGEIKGKVAYMPPEQLSGEVLDRRTDIYAAGVVLWELLTGRRLFQDGSLGSTVTNILMVGAPPPSLHGSDISPELDAVVLRALAKRPDERFSTARDMALELERCGSIASQRELGDWVERVARSALASRRSAVEMLGGAAFDDEETDVGGGAASPRSARTAAGHTPSDVMPLEKRRAPRRSWPVLLAAASAAVIASMVFFVRPPRVARPDAAAAAPMAESSQPAVSSVVPVPTVDPIVSGATPDAPPPPLPSGVAPSRPRVAAPRPPSTASRCNPPYTVAADGVRIYKPECF